MPYDKSLDREIFSESLELDDIRLTVSVFSYNNGPRKLQITRQNRDSKGEWHYARLGRMNKEEIEKILPIINKALENM